MERLNGADVVVVGGGVIGLAVAWRASQHGRRVAVVDPDPCGGASAAAAGWLAPITGPVDAAEPLRSFSLRARRRYPGFVAALQRDAGFPIDHAWSGSLTVALDEAGIRTLRELAGLARSAGLPAEEVGSAELGRREPALSGSIAVGLWLPEDGHIDPRHLCVALRTACGRAEVTHIPRHAERIVVEDGRVVGVAIADGTMIHADRVVLAAGAQAASVLTPAGTVPDIRPVKGDTVQIRVPGGRVVTRPVRILSEGRSTFVVPRADGSAVVGSTVIEGVDDTVPTPGAADWLLAEARRALPALGEVHDIRAAAGLRPAAGDGLPVVGPSALPGLLLALGHHSKGILEAPLTADLITDRLLGLAETDLDGRLAPSRLLSTEVAP